MKSIFNKAPIITCICGSGRFLGLMRQVAEKCTLSGEIVLMIGINKKDFARSSELKKYKPMLDELHKKKIQMCDHVYIINPSGYIGESTSSEIRYAISINKEIYSLEPIDLNLYS